MLDKFNESDVREEFAVPFIKKLGYEKGTENEILREQSVSLRYPHAFLGRKNPGKDPVLIGRPDYVLSVNGFGRWVLEIKSPNQEVTIDVIEQTMSYARHPEISARYAAIMNGREFRLYDANRRSHDDPIYTSRSCDPITLFESLENVLSPWAIKRDLLTVGIDLAKSLGGGLRSSEIIRGGNAMYVTTSAVLIDGPVNICTSMIADLNAKLEKMHGVHFPARSGAVSRDQSGRIIAEIEWAYPHQEMEIFARNKGLQKIKYVCNDEQISLDENLPSNFDYFGEMNISEGESVYDITEWKSLEMGFPANNQFRGRALGFLQGRSFKGIFQSEVIMDIRVPNLPICTTIRQAGVFEVHL